MRSQLDNRCVMLLRTPRKRSWTLLLLLPLLALLLGGQPAPPRVITAQGFVVVDAEGKPRLTLGVPPEPEEPDFSWYFGVRPGPGLFVLDSEGILRLWSGVSSVKSHPGLRIYDASGVERVSVGDTGDGLPQMTYQTEGNPTEFVFPRFDSDRTEDVLSSWLAVLLQVLVCAVSGFSIAWALRRWTAFRGSAAHLALVSSLTAIFLLTAALGQLGWQIQTWSNGSPAELLDDALFRGATFLGSTLLFFECAWRFLVEDVAAS